MEPESQIKRIRIYLSNTDKLKETLLYEALVFAARRYEIAGVTVIKGIMGYGTSSVIHSIKFWEVSDKLPVVVEIVDEAEKIQKYLDVVVPWIENLRYGCLITSEEVQVVLHKKGQKKGFFN